MRLVNPYFLRLILITATLLIALPLSAVAKPEPGLDIVLVLDSSGSMKRNDPKRMRVEAARMFVTLLDEQDRVAIVSFSGKATSKSGLVSLKSYRNEQALLHAIETVSADGSYTNIHEAIRKGYQLLKRSKRKEKIIVLMSDGKMDVGVEEKNLQLLERTLDELTPRLAKKEIKIYSIAFTENSYIPLLRLAAKDTRGHFMMLKNANGIHQVFENIFERTKNPDMLPMQEDSFIVDNAVNELTIVASKFRPSATIALENPSGDDFTEDTEASNIKWFSAKKFDLITITNPQPGYWNIKFSEGGNKAYILTNVSLEASVSKKQVQPGNPLELQTWLEKDGKKVNKRNLLAAMKFIASITYPDGREDDVKLTDDGSEIGSSRKDGIYGATITFTEEGLHKITTRSRGETFDRERSVFVTVKALEGSNPFAIKDLPKVTETPQPEAMPAQSPEPVVDAPVEHMMEDDGKPEALVQPIVHDTIEPEPLDETPDAETGDEKEGEIDITSAIIAFVLFNIAIGGGVVSWIMYRRHKKKKQASEDTKDAIDLSDEDAGDGGAEGAEDQSDETGGETSNDELN